MKTLTYSLILFGALLLMGCESKTESKKSTDIDSLTQSVSLAKIQVMYFHGDRRCPSCIAIGDETGNLLKANFDADVKSGTIAFVEINVDDEKNAKLAEKYQVAGSALLVVKTEAGKEEVTDLTGDGFKLAMNMPDMFKEKLKVTIDNYLK